MAKTWLGAFIFIILVFFAGCGGGVDSIDSILDVRNPSVVNNVIAFSAHRRIRIAWDRNVNSEVIAYNVYRSSALEGGFNLVGSVGQTSSPFFQDEGSDSDGDGIPDGLANNVTYFYKVTALDRAGRETPLSLSAAISAVPGVLPNETINLSVENVSAYAGTNEAYLTWSKLDHDQIFGYYVYRTTSGNAGGYELIGVTPAEINGFIDGGLSITESYVYQVAPAVNELEDVNGKTMTSGLLEGRRTQSRAVRPQNTDTTVPNAPGSNPNAPFSVQAQKAVLQGKDGILVQFTRPVSNTDGSLLVDDDDLISGSYLVFRSRDLYGKYDLVGVLENIGVGNLQEFFDPHGNELDYYYVKVGDNFGNISAQSDIASASGQVPPPTVKQLSATSGQGFGSIVLEWSEIPNQRLDGYNVYRSDRPDSGFVAIAHNIIDETPIPDKVQFTDVSAALAIGKTYYYKISSNANGLESSLSIATAASPGPANGIVVLEGENAVKIDSYIIPAFCADCTEAERKQLRTPPAQNPQQYWPPHWVFQRQGYHSPFSGNGVLLLEPQFSATTNILNGERIDLMWRVDVQALIGQAVGGAFTADVYLQTADDNLGGQYKILLDDKVINNNLAPGLEPPSSIDTGFDGIQTEINFRDNTFSTPIQPTRRLIGTLRIDHLADYSVPTGPITNGNAGTETIYMTLIHSGPVGTTSNFGDLKLDALILVLR